MKIIIDDLEQKIIDQGDFTPIGHVPKKFLNERKLENFILSRKEERNKLLRLQSLPYHIVMEPTNVCNLACPLCSTGLGSLNRKKGIMLLENYKKLIDSIKYVTLELYLQNWGEPTLVGYLPEIARYAADAGIWTHISTNFSFKQSENYLNDLMSSGLAVLQIDLDGATEDVYQTYRRGGNLGVVLDNIRKAVEIKKRKNLEFPIIETAMMIMRHNEHQIGECEKISRELGADRHRIGRIQINPNTSTRWLPKNKEFIYSTYMKEGKPKSCHWPWSGLVINWDGGISPCCIVDDAGTDFGNVFKEGLPDIWNNDFFVSSRSEFGDKKDIRIKTICNVCKNDTHSPKLKRFRDSFSIVF